MSVRKTVYCSDNPTPEDESVHAFTDVRDVPEKYLYITATCYWDVADGEGRGTVQLPWSEAVAMAKAILSEDEHAAL